MITTLTHLDWWLVLHVVSGALTLLSLTVLFVAWKRGKVMHALYYYLGLYDPDGRPSNRKVLTTAAVLAGVVGILSFGIRIIARSGDVSATFVEYVTVVMAVAAGHAILRDKVSGNQGASRESGAFRTPSETLPPKDGG